ncbi:MAG: FHA domain-containing protein [Deltaproteobacteria bacterium]|nr:MAG: FHA domain-containing protein [Deltaproteobacteria bacterium]
MAKLIIKKDKEAVEEFLLKEEGAGIGRDEGNEVILTDRSVSRRHARVFREGERWLLEDLGSSNGTFIEGRKIEKEELISGTEFRIGEFSITFEEEKKPVVDEDYTIIGRDAEGTAIAEKPEEGTRLEKVDPERTVCRDELPEDAGEGFQKAMLVALGGPLEGETYPLNNAEFTIGRGGKNHLIITDPLVSLSHALIVPQGELFLLKDRESKNGTLVNGKPIKENTLKMGDIIKIGPQELRFVEKGEIYSLTLDQKEAGISLELKDGATESQLALTVKNLGQTIRKRPLIPIAILLIAFFLVVLLFQTGPEKTEVVEPEIAEPLPDEQSIKIQAFEHLTQGLEYFNSQLWQEAQESFTQALSLDPQNEKARIYQEKVLREQENKLILEKGKEYHEQGLWEDALAELRKLPPESFYYTQAQREISQVQEQQIDTLISESQSALEEKKWDEADQKLNQVLSIDPDNTQAQELKSQVEKEKEEQKKIAERKKQPTRPKKKTVAKPPKKVEKEAKVVTPASETPKVSKPGSPELTEQLATAIKKYIQGDIDRAVGDLQKIIDQSPSPDAYAAKEARKKIILMVNVKKYYDQGTKDLDQGKKDQALKAWNTMLSFDKRLSAGIESFYATRTTPQVVKILQDQGEKSYLAAKYQEAFSFWQRAIELDPSSKGAQEGLAKLSLHAQELYREAYVLERVNLEEAVKRWKQVIEIVPSTDEYHQKSREKLEQYR